MADANISSQKTYGDEAHLVFADHASNAIPAEFNNLGVPDDMLQTHIAWDIGAGALSAAMAERLGGVNLQCEFSRLLIDPNRSPDAHDFVPAASDRIPIAGNLSLDDESRNERRRRFFDPYHEVLDETLDSFASTPFVTSIHSFSPQLMGAMEERPWHVGLLWRDDPETAHHIKEWLGENTDFCVGDNQPYDARIFNYSVDRHLKPRKLPHVTFEVRQDLLSNQAEIDKMADILARAITEVAQTR